MATVAEQIETFIKHAGEMEKAGKALAQTLMEIPLEEFRETVFPVIRGADLTDLSTRHIREILKEVVEERRICRMCYLGTMSEPGRGRGYHSTSTCSNPECRSQISVAS